MNNLINKIVKETIEKAVKHIIDENRVVTFDNIAFPNFGWCVILAGGPGSGKGYALEKLVTINGKVINVDDFKKLYVRMKNGIINGKKYDSGDPAQVSTVHDEIKNRDYKTKYMNMFFNRKARDSERLSNIIFDMTGKAPKEIIEIAELANKLGYKTSLIWVVANRNEALLRNLTRPRRVADSVLHRIHNALLNNMPGFLTSKISAIYLSEAWILFCSTSGIMASDLNQEEAKDAAVKLNKTSDGFIIDKKYLDRLYLYLGKEEKNPNNPITYMSSDEIAAKYGKPKYNNDGSIASYTFDRTQFNKDSSFLR